MSRFLSEKYASLAPYVPGEQPKEGEYVKLNTNESPFAPPMRAVQAATASASKLALYSDPENVKLTRKAAEVLGVDEEEVLMTNGSDEALYFAFSAFCDESHPIAFPDITYGFYKVFCKLLGVACHVLPLKEDFTVDYTEYVNRGETIVIANPNAPTGLALPLTAIEEIVKSNPQNVVIIDEAYVDFGGESAVPLIKKYDNLLITQTFSKSRSLAGGRLGMAIGNKSLIADLKKIKYSTNPYNVNRMTAEVGYAVLCEEEWFSKNVQTICQNREYTAKKLEEMGFTVLPSKANFLFAKTSKIEGQTLYEKLKEKGVLVRHFKDERIKDYNRITVGSKAQMDIFLAKVQEIVEEEE